MRRLIALLAVGTLALAACTSDDPTIGASPGAEGIGGLEGNQPPPEVEPQTIPEGESTAIEAKVVDRGTDPTEEFAGPRLLLVRNREAGQQAADAAPVDGAAEAIRSWDRYAQRALIAVYGASQPDSGYRINLGDVSVTKRGRTLTVFAEVVQRGEAAAQVVSMPWMVLSVPAGFVALAERCIMAFQGLDAAEGRC